MGQLDHWWELMLVIQVRKLRSGQLAVEAELGSQWALRLRYLNYREAGTTPPNTADLNYVSGVGVGTSAGTGFIELWLGHDFRKWTRGHLVVRSQDLQSGWNLLTEV